MTIEQQQDWLDEMKSVLGNGRDHFNLEASYVESLRTVLDTIDADTIRKKKKYTVSLKSYLLDVKGEDRHILTPLIKTVSLHILDIRNGKLHLEGRCLEKYIDPEYEITIRDENNQTIHTDQTLCPAYDQGGCFGKEKLPGYIFTADLPIHPGASYTFWLEAKGKKPKHLKIRYGKFSRLTSLENSFFVQEDLIFKSTPEHIRIYKNQLKTRLASSHRLTASINDAGITKLRKAGSKLKKQSRPIWIISDRTDSAGDNGEALFSYLMSNGAGEKYDIYFLISEDSPDYERMRQIGKVLKLNSPEHFQAVLAADLIISSSGDDWVTNPFGKDRIYYGDLMTAKFVFLQHGVTIHDLSGWLNRIRKNIRMFCCVSENEMQSICKNNFAYDKGSAKLTGFARYDKLHDDTQKIISFMPTWRKETVPVVISGTSDRPYTPDFKKTEFFEFYNTLINDERILTALKDSGYTGIFYPHPNFHKQICDFNSNDCIKTYDGIAPYSKVFNESAMLITDYSSVAMDFAYLRKPIVYTQFDYEEFYAAHTVEEGYFDFEKNGFGPVCYDYEQSVSTIVQQIQGDCTMSDTYKRRIDDFFYYNDNKNCERIYLELEKLSEK